MHFTSDISIWWLLPWGVLAVIGSLYYYKNVSWIASLQPKWQWLLKILRASVLFLLGFLLIGLVFESVDFRQEKPLIIALIDESASMKNYADSNQVASQVKALEEAMNAQLGEQYELAYMHTGAGADYGKFSAFQDGISDLSAGFSKINTDFYNRNVGAVIFVSDGNFNVGTNPVYEAEKLNFTPVFSLGVGDTVPKRDQLIRNIAVNDVTFYKNKFPVEVDVEAVKMGQTSATVSIERAGKKIASQQIQYKDGKLDYEHLTFLLDADKTGFQTYTVSVNHASNESNYTNNHRIFYVEVIDSRSKMLFLSGAPHPDITAMKQLAEQDQNLEVKAELLSKWNRELKNVDLIVWHEPGIGFDQSVLNLIQEHHVPVLYVIGSNTPSTVINKLGLGLTVSGGNQSDEVQGALNESFQQFQVSDRLKESFQYFPPLSTKFGQMNLPGSAEVLVWQRIGPVKKKEPLIFFGKKGTEKYGVIYGEGFWKWKMNDFVRNGDFSTVTELLNSITHYLLVKQNTTALHITFPKRFTKDDAIEVNASFYNASMEPVTEPVITMEITDERGKKQKNQFAVAGDFYSMSLGKLKPGKYSWKASTQFNGKHYQKSGVFVVEDVNMEQMDSYANHGILRQISARTHGNYHALKSYQLVLDAIKKRDDIATVSYKETAFNDLIDYEWLFFLLLFLLTAEWFLRRWFGGY